MIKDLMIRHPLGPLRTRHVENVLVGSVLVASTLLSSLEIKDWVACLAIFCSFKHAQIADRMREQDEIRADSSVDCPQWSTRFFVSKEILWIVFFLITSTYTAIAGSALFLLYPFWRAFYRSKFPVV